MEIPSPEAGLVLTLIGVFVLGVGMSGMTCLVAELMRITYETKNETITFSNWLAMNVALVLPMWGAVILSISLSEIYGILDIALPLIILMIVIISLYTYAAIIYGEPLERLVKNIQDRLIDK